MSAKELLEIVSAVAPIVSALTAVTAATFVSIQIRNIRRNRDVDTFLKIAALLDSDRSIEAIDWLERCRKGLTFDDFAQDQNGWRNFRQVVNICETIGALINNKYVSKQLLFDKYGLFISGAWDKLQETVGSVRGRNNIVEYAENFEDVARRYETWADENAPKTKQKGRATGRVAGRLFQPRGGKNE